MACELHCQYDLQYGILKQMNSLSPLFILTASTAQLPHRGAVPNGPVCLFVDRHAQSIMQFVFFANCNMLLGRNDDLVATNVSVRLFKQDSSWFYVLRAGTPATTIRLGLTRLHPNHSVVLFRATTGPEPHE